VRRGHRLAQQCLGLAELAAMYCPNGVGALARQRARRRQRSLARGVAALDLRSRLGDN
jgi:hypothetical protein